MSANLPIRQGTVRCTIVVACPTRVYASLNTGCPRQIKWLKNVHPGVGQDDGAIPNRDIDFSSNGVDIEIVVSIIV